MTNLHRHQQEKHYYCFSILNYHFRKKYYKVIKLIELVMRCDKYFFVPGLVKDQFSSCIC